MKVIFVTADNIQSAPMEVPDEQVKNHRAWFRLLRPTLPNMVCPGDPIRGADARCYDRHGFEYILIDGHREPVALYRERQ